MNEKTYSELFQNLRKIAKEHQNDLNSLRKVIKNEISAYSEDLKSKSIYETQRGSEVGEFLLWIKLSKFQRCIENASTDAILHFINEFSDPKSKVSEKKENLPQKRENQPKEPKVKPKQEGFGQREIHLTFMNPNHFENALADAKRRIKKKEVSQKRITKPKIHVKPTNNPESIGKERIIENPLSRKLNVEQKYFEIPPSKVEIDTFEDFLKKYWMDKCSSGAPMEMIITTLWVFLENLPKFDDEKSGEETKKKYTDFVEKKLKETFSKIKMYYSNIEKKQCTEEKVFNDSAVVCIMKFLTEMFDYNEEKLEFKYQLDHFSLFRKYCNGAIESKNVIESIIKSENEDEVLLLVSQYINKYPEFRDSLLINGKTLIYFASYCGRTKLVEYLANYVDCNNVGDHRVSERPLHAAALSGDKKIYDALKKRGAKPLFNQNGESPITYLMNEPRNKNLTKNESFWEYQPDKNLLTSWKQLPEDISCHLNGMVQSNQFGEGIALHQGKKLIVNTLNFWIILEDGTKCDLRCLEKPFDPKKIKWQYQDESREWKDYSNRVSVDMTNTLMQNNRKFSHPKIGRSTSIDFVKFQWQRGKGGGEERGPIRWIVKKNPQDEEQYDIGDNISSSMDVLRTLRREKKSTLNQIKENTESKTLDKNYNEFVNHVTEKTENIISGNVGKFVKMFSINKSPETNKNPKIIETLVSIDFYDPSNSRLETMIFNKILQLSSNIEKELISKDSSFSKCSITFIPSGKKSGQIGILFIGTEYQQFVLENRILLKLKCFCGIFSESHVHIKNSQRKIVEKHKIDMKTLRENSMNLLGDTIMHDKFMSKYLYIWKGKVAENTKKFKSTMMDQILNSEFESIISGASGWTKKLQEIVISETKKLIKSNDDLKRICAVETIKEILIEEMDRQTSRNLLEKEYNPKSTEAMKYFINDVLVKDFRDEVEKNPSFEKSCCQHIPSIFYRFRIFLKAYSKNLPVFTESRDIIERVKKHDVFAIKTSTGSGKSTLLPLLLFASNCFKKIIITQPRRFPCYGICNYLQEQYGSDVVGYAVSGKNKNIENPLLYVTDGLLREIILHNDTHLTEKWGCDLLILDEVHERGINIDLLIALIVDKKSRGMYNNLKLILSSATLDDMVLTPFTDRPRIFKVDKMILRQSPPFPIKTIINKNSNPLSVVKDLSEKRMRNEQILCFLPGVGDVNKACQLFKEKYNIKAYPLYAQQSPSVQKRNLMIGSIFFSTNIAETSLTFPNLKYVVDTGLVNVSKINLKTNVPELVSESATQSTMEQRAGRTGRTCPGEYHQLFEYGARQKFPSPQIEKIDLIDYDFALRRSPCYPKGLLSLESKCFPGKGISRTIVDYVSMELEKMGIVNHYTKELTNLGLELIQYPNMGGVRNTRCVYTAFRLGCGGDMIRLSAMLMALPNNPQAFLSSIPERFNSPNGDFEKLLKVFNAALNHVKVVGSNPKKKSSFTSMAVGPNVGVGQNGGKVLEKAINKYKDFEREFSKRQEFADKASLAPGNWELICKSLLSGYYHQTFYKSSLVHAPSREFIQLHPNNNYQRCLFNPHFTSLDGKTAECFVSRTVFKTNIKESNRKHSMVNVSILGLIPKPSLMTHQIIRIIRMTEDEIKKYRNGLGISKTNLEVRERNSKGEDNKNRISLEVRGPAGLVMDFEKKLCEKLVITKNVKLIDYAAKDNNGKIKESLQDNLVDAWKYCSVFMPMRYRYENQCNCKINWPKPKYISSITPFEFKIKGRDSHVTSVVKEIKSFMSWMGRANVLQNPGQKMTPKIVQPRNEQIEDRIQKITDPDRDFVSIWEATEGANATRESRMEVAAWIAITKFDCLIVGGFVRDWIVRGKKVHPEGDPKKWLIRNSRDHPDLVPKLIPADLDLELPYEKYFNVTHFQKELMKCGITCDEVVRHDWRYILVLDKNKKPFTLDLIEPHIVLTHDMIDFDCNNLICKKNWTREIGLRINTGESTGEKIKKTLEVDSIVSRITDPEGPYYVLMRDKDYIMKQRIEKMKLRGWKCLREEFYIPVRQNKPTTIKLNSSSDEYKKLADPFSVIGKVKSIHRIKNGNLSLVFNGMEKQVAKENSNDANIKLLFHGTKRENFKNIIQNGFDDRYWRSGLFGVGAYFADDVKKSHNYTDKKKTCFQFWVKVICGRQKKVSKSDRGLLNPGVEYHSVFAERKDYPNEYIVYRYGVALPHAIVEYIPK